MNRVLSVSLYCTTQCAHLCYVWCMHIVLLYTMHEDNSFGNYHLESIRFSSLNCIARGVGDDDDDDYDDMWFGIVEEFFSQ